MVSREKRIGIVEEIDGLEKIQKRRKIQQIQPAQVARTKAQVARTKAQVAHTKAQVAHSMAQVAQTNSRDADAILTGSIFEEEDMASLRDGTPKPLSPVIMVEDDEYTQVELLEDIQEDDDFDCLDEDLLEALGEDPTEKKGPNIMIHDSIKRRWKHWMCEGLKKEDKDELITRYEGVDWLQAAALNEEIKGTMSESAKKRDEHFIDHQMVVGASQSALGIAISTIMNGEGQGVDKVDLFKLLCDAGKLLAGLQKDLTVARRAFIAPPLNKQTKELLERTKVDKFLFGENLNDKIKNAKDMHKLTDDLKYQPTPKYQQKYQQASRYQPPQKYQSSARGRGSAQPSRPFLAWRTRENRHSGNPQTSRPVAYSRQRSGYRSETSRSQQGSSSYRSSRRN